MNGLAKASGIFSILAGVLFIVAVVMGLNAGLGTGDSLEAFGAVQNFKYLTFAAGLLAVFAGYAAASYGGSKRCFSDSIYGVFVAFFGVVLVLCAFKADLNTLTWAHMNVLIIATAVVSAAAFALACAAKREYIFADVAILLAFLIVVVYALDLKIIVTMVAAIVILVLGALMFVAAKPRPEVEKDAGAAEAPAEVVEEERVITPAAAPVPAAPPVAKPVEEEPAEGAADKKAAAAPEKKAPAAAAEAGAGAAAPAAGAAGAAAAGEAGAAAPAAAAAGAAAGSSAAAGEAGAATPAAEAAPAAAADSEAAAAGAGAAAGSSAAAGEAGAGAAAAGAGAGAAAGAGAGAASSGAGAGAAVAGAAVAGAVVGAAIAQEEAPKEETELDRLLAQGWEVTVANVGEERACEMSDYEIMEVISVADPELYAKLSILTGIVVTAGTYDEDSGAMEADDLGLSDDDLGLIPDTPSGFVRRACWNKGLRCRKDYGPYYIPFAFVKSKVAIYIDGPTPDNRNDEVLRENSWVVLHFPEADVTDGQKEAEIINDAVKENTRALKKAKAKKKKKR